jgi:hypothetical protein
MGGGNHVHAAGRPLRRPTATRDLLFLARYFSSAVMLDFAGKFLACYQRTGTLYAVIE